MVVSKNATWTEDQAGGIKGEEACTSPLFSYLSPEDYAELFQEARYLEREKGELVFQEGLPAEGIYLICSGKVKLVQQTPDKRKKQILKILGPGDLLGEETFFAGGTYNAYARALEPTKLCFFPREAFLRFLDRHPSVALQLLERLSQEVKEYQNLLVESAYERSEERLARMLLELGRKFGHRERRGEGETYVIDLSLSRAELAELLGLRPETTIRILRRWQDEGLLEIRGRRLIILDEEGLAAYVKPFPD